MDEVGLPTILYFPGRNHPFVARLGLCLSQNAKFPVIQKRYENNMEIKIIMQIIDC